MPSFGKGGGFDSSPVDQPVDTAGVISGSGGLEVAGAAHFSNTLGVSGSITSKGEAPTFESATANKPNVTITNTTNDINGAWLTLKKDRSAGTAADDDNIGTISWYGDNDAGEQEEFARITTFIGDASNGTERGKLRMSVAEYDGTVTTGFEIRGDSDDGVIDWSLGAGANSFGSISGDVGLGHDAAALYFGADSDITMTHDHNVGLELKGDGANTALKINNTAANGDPKIEFQLGGGTLWAIGCDDSDGDKLIIENGNGTLGTAPALVITSGGEVSITSAGLTTGNALYVEDDSSNTSTRNTVEIVQENASATGAIALHVQSDGGTTGMSIDKNYSDTDLANVIGLHVDVDKTGASTAGNYPGMGEGPNFTTGIYCSVDNTTATDGVNFLSGINAAATFSYAEDAGFGICTGGRFTATGHTNGTSFCIGVSAVATGADTNIGMILNTPDAASSYDLVIESADNTDNYFAIATTANGATTILTEDSGGTAGHLTISPDGDIAMTPAGGLFSIGSGKHIITIDQDIRYADSGDNTVIVELPAVKIPANAIITSVVAVVKTASNLSTHAVNVQMSATSGTNADSSISSGTELLGAGVTNTDSTDSASAEDIDLKNDPKEVWICRDTVRNGSSDQYVYICNAGTGNGTTNSSAGTLTVIIEYYGMD